MLPEEQTRLMLSRMQPYTYDLPPDDTSLHRVLDECLEGISTEAGAMHALNGAILPELLHLFLAASGSEYPRVLLYRGDDDPDPVIEIETGSLRSEILAFAASFLIGFCRVPRAFEMMRDRFYVVTKKEASGRELRLKLFEFVVEEVIFSYPWSNYHVRSAVFKAFAALGDYPTGRDVYDHLFGHTQLFRDSLTQHLNSFYLECDAKSLWKANIRLHAEAGSLGQFFEDVMELFQDMNDRLDAASAVIDCALLAFVDKRNSDDAMKVLAQLLKEEGLVVGNYPMVYLETEVALFLYRHRDDGLNGRFRCDDLSFLLDYGSFGCLTNVFGKLLFCVDTKNFCGSNCYLPMLLLAPVFALSDDSWAETKRTRFLEEKKASWVKSIQRCCGFVKRAKELGMTVEKETTVVRVFVGECLVLLEPSNTLQPSFSERQLQYISTALISVITDFVQRDCVGDMTLLLKLSKAITLSLKTVTSNHSAFSSRMNCLRACLKQVYSKTWDVEVKEKSSIDLEPSSTFHERGPVDTDSNRLTNAQEEHFTEVLTVVKKLVEEDELWAITDTLLEFLRLLCEDLRDDHEDSPSAFFAILVQQKIVEWVSPIGLSRQRHQGPCASNVRASALAFVSTVALLPQFCRVAAEDWDILNDDFSWAEFVDGCVRMSDPAQETEAVVRAAAIEALTRFAQSSKTATVEEAFGAEKWPNVAEALIKAAGDFDRDVKMKCLEFWRVVLEKSRIQSVDGAQIRKETLRRGLKVLVMVAKYDEHAPCRDRAKEVFDLFSGDADSDIKAEMEEPCDGQKSGIVSFPKFSSFEDILNVGWYKPQKQEIEILPDCY